MSAVKFNLLKDMYDIYTENLWAQGSITTDGYRATDLKVYQASYDRSRLTKVTGSAGQGALSFCGLLFVRDGHFIRLLRFHKISRVF